MLNVTLLGCGGGMPMPSRFLSSLVINYRGRKILMDCGEGTQVAMRKMNTGFKNIDIICLTHMHGDHIFGLPGLLTTMGNSERKENVTIIGTEGTCEVVKGLMSSITYLPFELNIIENPIKPLTIINSIKGLQVKQCDKFQSHEMVITTIELDHSSPCLGYSFYLMRRRKFSLQKAAMYNVPKEVWGKLQKSETVTYESKIFEPDMVLGEERKGIKISFTTDTRPIETLPAFIHKSDLFICEGNYGDNEDMEKAKKNKHMTFKEAGELAKEGHVKELLITHFSPALDKPELYGYIAEEIFNNIIIGYDGFSKSLSFEE